MRSVFLVAAISAIAWARPETYKETEDFKYSRSSSDDGTKAGFYGAQRGNMGGNYEHAHNMDSLAQNQMSGAVRQVEGELGDAAKTRTGSVFTAANSRGIYGSGNYDLSNLQGRNFAESSSFHDTHSSLSSAFNQHSQNADWRSQSQQSGLGASNHFGQAHAAEDSNGIYTHGQSNVGKSYGHASGFQSQSGYRSQSGYQGGSAYDQLRSNTHTGSYGAQTGDQTQGHYVITPVRIITRPGMQVAVPVFAQAHDSQKSSAFSQNSEAEILNNNHQHVSVPQSNAKHYESSYDYRKAWERHSETNPSDVSSVVPTVNPFPKNSELNEDTQASIGWDGQQHSNGYNVQSGSSQSRHQSEYNSQHNSHSGSSSNAYTQGAHGSLTGASLTAADAASQPKSYQSSYSYHKSWERQGDPYVIYPASNGGTKNSASSSHQQYRQAHQHSSHGNSLDCDCDEYGNVRAKRSPSYRGGHNTDNLGKLTQSEWDAIQKIGQTPSEDLGQQIQQSWGNFEQQNKPEKLEDLGQQIQQLWQGSYQQSQNKLESLEDLGQQTQQSWGTSEQQNLPDKLEDLGQQTQEAWKESDQQTQNKLDSLQDLGQQTQQSWGNIEQQSKPEKLEDLGQQVQETWRGSEQQTQNKFDNLQDLGQQTQQSWGNFEQPNRPEKLEDLGQHSQQSWDHENIEQQVSQQSQQTFGELENQQTQSKLDDFSNLGQQTQQSFDSKDFTEQQPQNQNIQDFGQHTDHIDLGQQSLTQWGAADKNQNTLGIEQQTLMHAHSVDQMNDGKLAGHNRDTQQITHNSDYFHNSNHPAFWEASNGQTHQHNEFLNQNSYSNVNSHYNSQRHGVNWQETNKDEEPTTRNNPLQSLWDKIDNLEEQSDHSSYDRHDMNEFTGYENSQHSYHGHGRTYDYGSTSGFFSNSNNASEHRPLFKEHKPSFTLNETEKTNNKNKKEQGPEDNRDETVTADIPEIVEATDVGRGDIGADDSQSDKSIHKNVPVSETVSIDIKPEKTPKEIEALSLSTGTEKNKNLHNSDTEHLSVLSLDQQKWLHDQRQAAYDNRHTASGSSLTVNKTNTLATINENVRFNENNIEKHFDNSSSHSVAAVRHDSHHHNKQNETESKHSSEHQDQDLHKGFGQESVAIGGQRSGQQFEHFGQNQESSTFYQQSTGHQLEDFGQQNQDIHQYLHNFENHNQLGHKFDQQNTWQQSEDFGQQTQDINQQNLQNFESQNQHNLEQQLQDFGQQSQDLNQHSLQQFETSGKFGQNIEQQHTGQKLEDFGQHGQGEQHLEQVETSGDFSQYQNHQMVGQQLEDFGQQSQDLTQHNLQHFENLGQQSQHDLNDDFNKLNRNKDSDDKKTRNTEFPNNKEVHEENIGKIDIPGSQSNPKEEVEVPAGPPTEKPGFWKSVGSKFTSAKDSVASWFKRS